MKFTLFSTLFVATLTTLVAAQGAASVDDLFSREESQLFDREAEDFAMTYVLREMDDHARYVKRSVEILERRGRSVCYVACNQFTGKNKKDCLKKCDAIWGP